MNNEKLTNKNKYLIIFSNFRSNTVGHDLTALDYIEPIERFEFLKKIKLSYYCFIGRLS